MTEEQRQINILLNFNLENINESIMDSAWSIGTDVYFMAFFKLGESFRFSSKLMPSCRESEVLEVKISGYNKEKFDLSVKEFINFLIKRSGKDV